MFAYCLNNPLIYTDSSGYIYAEARAVLRFINTYRGYLPGAVGVAWSITQAISLWNEGFNFMGDLHFTLALTQLAAVMANAANPYFWAGVGIANWILSYY